MSIFKRFLDDSSVQPSLGTPGGRLAGGYYTFQMEDTRECGLGQTQWVKVYVGVWDSDVGKDSENSLRSK